VTIVDQTHSSQLTDATGPPSRRPRRRKGPLTRVRARVTNPDWGHLAPLLLVAIAIGFNLYVLRGELATVANLNDTGVHISMVRWAEQRLSSGSLVFDGWYPRLRSGSRSSTTTRASRTSSVARSPPWWGPSAR
jgi:hypothetical protein